MTRFSEAAACQRSALLAVVALLAALPGMVLGADEDKSDDAGIDFNTKAVGLVQQVKFRWVSRESGPLLVRRALERTGLRRRGSRGPGSTSPVAPKIWLPT